MAWGARLVGARPAREANDAECQVDRGVGFASKLGSNRTAYGSDAHPVGARPAREANNAECQADRGAGFASKLGSNRGSGSAILVGLALSSLDIHRGLMEQTHPSGS